jgi:hypothetical protein
MEDIMSDIKIGTEVRYAVKFLRSIFAYTGPIAHATGTVTALTPFGGGNNSLVSIDWHGEDLPGKVLSANLTIVGSRKAQFESIA